MNVNAASFMAAASEAYRELENSTKQYLLQEGKEVMLTSADIKKRGLKIFEKIEKLVARYFNWKLVVVTGVVDVTFDNNSFEGVFSV